MKEKQEPLRKEEEMKMECLILEAKYELKQAAIQVKILEEIILSLVEQYQTFPNNLVCVLEELVQNVMLSPKLTMSKLTLRPRPKINVMTMMS